MNRKDFDALAQMRGIPKDCAEWFWNTHDARNWLDATGQPILKVEPLLLNALASWRSRHRPHAVRQSTSSPPGKISGAELILRQKEYERVIEAIARIRRNAATDAMGTTMYSEKEKRELAELRARREELKQLLNLKI